MYDVKSIIQFMYSSLFRSCAQVHGVGGRRALMQSAPAVQLGTIGRTYEMQADTHLGNFFETGVASLRNKGHMMKSQVRYLARAVA